MINIKLIREKPDYVRDMVARKGVKVDIDSIARIDGKYRELLKQVEEMRARKNEVSDKIVKVKDAEDRKKIIGEMKELDVKQDGLEFELEARKKEFDALLYQIPNLPLEDVPVGADEKSNVVLREVGKKPEFDFTPKDYMTLGEKLQLINTERAVKVSGSRFGYLKREAALLEFALVQFALETLGKENFIPIVPPVLVKPEMMQAMGYVERGGEEIYYIEKDNLYLVGTSEQAIGPLHADEVFSEEELPVRVVAFSTCFRREAGSYGKDTKGILRVHQFDKVEMFSFCHPEKSRQEHQFLLSMEEKLMSALKIPYHVLNICTGDLGDPAASKYDVEAWLPGQNEYRETHSTSNTTDFQARRLNIKYRDSQTGKPEFVHMLNGTAFAIGRTIIAILENYQQKDGSIKIPEVLQKYTGFKVIEKAL